MATLPKPPPVYPRETFRRWMLVASCTALVAVGACWCVLRLPLL